VVSTRIPVSATMRSTIVTKIAMAVRPNSGELLAGEAVGVALDWADTVAISAS
jgi:hypothetical protein